MDQVDSETDFDKRYELVQQATAILDEDPPTVEYWYNRTLAAWRTCVHGIEGKHGALFTTWTAWTPCGWTTSAAIDLIANSS